MWAIPPSFSSDKEIEPRVMIIPGFIFGVERKVPDTENDFVLHGLQIKIVF